MKEILQKLSGHKTLSRKEAHAILKEITDGRYNQTQVTAFITMLMMRSVTPDELAGFRDALLELSIPLDLSDYNTIDLCGTGGDEKNTFNISTLSSLVVAGAGYKVAKHGNYGVSSACGSSTVMEYFGYKFTNNQASLRKMMEETGMVYLHAPLFHPAMKSVGPIRRSLGMKTFFNMIGPLVNPVRPANQFVGVYDLETLRLYSYIYQQTGMNYNIVYSMDGYDEISLTGSFKLIGNEENSLISPEQIGFDTLKPEDLFGGNTVEEAISIFKEILNGKGTKAQNSVVLANSGMAIKTIHPEKSLEQCIEEAKSSLFGGKAKKVLKKLVYLSCQMQVQPQL
ncbi:MAG: anthranilate phosphoribosyltransferase [Prolixibacteraceae bacterium]|nr:anthranilate phosphoribosyltransferase [Prolixibacteraceae bacterium]